MVPGTRHELSTAPRVDTTCADLSSPQLRGLKISVIYRQQAIHAIVRALILQAFIHANFEK